MPQKYMIGIGLAVISGMFIFGAYVAFHKQPSTSCPITMDTSTLHPGKNYAGIDGNIYTLREGYNVTRDDFDELVRINSTDECFTLCVALRHPCVLTMMYRDETLSPGYYYASVDGNGYGPILVPSTRRFLDTLVFYGMDTSRYFNKCIGE